ncbi:hypothetical protein [Ornithinimicrobium cryptoxanthini]|uniref:Uncharacterized protein n=1 Tax=Ornithinimicrobium cryptoxanthini TaxID=2934161 RepID=A0ABY4YMR3_9MICO|nr:hypothetical protein [Ornithinimicrobium cryptoxanthini]USQ77826.1 hypothetical protein NF557_08030 [Ornithinimicrobium cryptoxanthini]
MMPLDQPVTTPAAAQVLVRMHQLLWQASTEAHRRACAAPDPPAVDLAFILDHLCAQVYDLVPGDYRDALLDRPATCGADPVDLAAQAEGLSRQEPVNDFPPGICLVVVRLIDTVRDFS